MLGSIRNLSITKKNWPNGSVSGQILNRVDIVQIIEWCFCAVRRENIREGAAEEIENQIALLDEECHRYEHKARQIEVIRFACLLICSFKFWCAHFSKFQELKSEDRKLDQDVEELSAKMVETKQLIENLKSEEKFEAQQVEELSKIRTMRSLSMNLSQVFMGIS